MPSPALLASVEVPASSANLGSGFDCFAAALSLKLRAELLRGDEAGILLEAHGEGAPAPNADPEQNLVIRAFRAGLRTAGGASVGSGAWRIEVASMIPAARGLGSSAAAIVAGLLLGATVGRRSPDPDELMALATDLEGHPDNVAAAIFGGITLAVTNPQAPATVRRFRVPSAWIPVVFITKAESRTADMRDVLPASIPFADAAAQAGRAALLATAVATADGTLLRLAMDDQLHQPYRLPRMPDSARLGCRAWPPACDSTRPEPASARPEHPLSGEGRGFYPAVQALWPTNPRSERDWPLIARGRLWAGSRDASSIGSWSQVEP
jgi:homoserine kinase